jgi:tellurite resistance protein
MKLDVALAQVYAQGLIAVARVDGEIGPEEGALLRKLVSERASGEIEIDHEASFFHKVTADDLAAAFRTAGVDTHEVGRAFTSDAVQLALVDGDLNGGEAQSILRYARALGCTDDDIRKATRELDGYL